MNKKHQRLLKYTYQFMETSIKASKGKTIDLIIEHKLQNVTPEMIDWWWDHIDTTERYNLWHPKDHKLFQWEVSPNKGHVGAIHLVLENIGEIPTMLRIRWEDPSLVPIPTTYSHVLVGSILDQHDVSINWIVHEYEAIEKGTQMRSIFRLPEKTPQQFITGLRKHNQEEMEQFSIFLPKLYKEV